VYVLVRFVFSVDRLFIIATEPEYFFRLVEEEAYIFTGTVLDHPRYLGQSLLAAAEHRGDYGDVHIPFISFYRTPGDHIVDGGFSQVGYRCCARPYRNDMPFGTGMCNEASIEHGKESAKHQRRFPATGISKYGEEVIL